MKRDVPEPWATAMKEAGVVDKRYGRPSWSALGRAVEVHASTIIAMADGARDTDVETIAKVAEQLRKTPQQIGEWIGESRPVGDPYVPPAESRFLSDEEKGALDELIKAIARGKKVGTEHGKRSAEKSSRRTVGGGTTKTTTPTEADS